jgi:hypothetical protein
VSILEVLFAIMVTTIGLLGAIAVFPVASAQARKGRMQDAMAVAGMSAAHDFDVRGMRKPANWIAFDGSGNRVLPYDQYSLYLRSAGGANWFGGEHAFCIDPRYIAKNSSSLTTARWFPCNISNSLHRVTLPGPDTANPIMIRAVADALFMFDDDLNFERPKDRSLNAYQIMDEDKATNTKYRRQSEGHMSWMATVVPKLDRNSTNFQDNYVLSVVVFYDRPMDDLALDSYSKAENVASIAGDANGFPGSGITGGEVVMTSPTSGNTLTGATAAEGLAALNRLKANDWVCLGATSNGKPIVRWYRVVDTDDEAVVNGSNYERHVTLFGQDWDPSLAATVAIVDGVVGVYEKTIRLDMSP